MKKFLSLVLALVMTMSLVTVSAGAKDFTDNSKINYKEAVDVMSAVKVIDGYAEGDFRPSATLTRGAAAKIICNLILGPTTASALVADAAPYSDVPTTHTFAGYIAYCQKEGIISGYADGTFRPANTLTGYAFMKMLLGALGYDAEVEQYTGANWSINVAKRALNIGLDDDLIGDFNGIKAVNREEACLYALNTLTADMVEYDAKTTVSTNGTTVVIAGSKAKEMVNNGNTDGKVFDKDGVMQFAEKYFDNLSVKKGSDAFGRPSNVWKLKAEEIGTYTNTADATYTKKVEVGDIYKDLGLGSKIEKKDVKVYVDGGADASQAPVAITKGDDTNKYGANGVLTEVFYDDDADTVTITEVNTYVGTIAKSVKATDKKDAYVVVTPEQPISGKAPISSNEEFETDEKFEDDAYVLYTYSKDAKEIKSVEAAKVITGTVTRAENDKENTADSKALTIDGTRYKDSKNVAGDKLSDVSVKNDYTIYLDSYGYMIYVEEKEEIGDYALVLQTASKSDFVGKKAELLFADGTTKVVTTEKNYSTGTDAIADNTIVTYKVDSDNVYTLRAVDTSKASYVYDDSALTLKNDKAGITITADTARGHLNQSTVTANSATVFVVRDVEDHDDYTAYTGIKNAPTMEASTAAGNQADVFLYCKSGKMVTIAFIMPGANMDVDDESSNALYIASESVSNLIHDKDGDYYEFTAVVNGEVKTIKVDQNVKIDNGTGLSSSVSKKVDGLFKGYSVDKHGVITNLKTFADYGSNNDTPAKKPGDNKESFVGVGIDKVSKEYTVVLNTAGKTLVPLQSKVTYQTYAQVKDLNSAYTGNATYGVKNETITMANDAKVYYVDKDGKIEASSYSAIAVDSNDIVYAIVKDYLVQTLYVREITDENAPTVDPADPTGTTSYVDAKSATVYVKLVDTAATNGSVAAEAKATLKAAGYTSINTTAVTAAGGTIVAKDADGDTVVLDVDVTVFYTVKVNGTTVEYVADSGSYTVKANDLSGKGTGYIYKVGTATPAYNGYGTAKAISSINGAVVIETGYVKVTNSISGSDPAIVVDGYAKANSSFTVEATYSSAANANEAVVLTYNTTETATGSADTDKKVFTFSIDTAEANVTLNSIAKVATFTVAAPKVVNGSGVEITGLNGLTVTAVADKTSAKSNDTVTVTVTVKGQATKATKLTTDAGNWDGTSSQAWTIPANTNYATAHTVIYTFTVSADATPTITVADA